MSSSDPLENLKNAFHSDEIETVIDAIKKMKIVADGLGPERTKKDLVPFLTEEAGENEDEALKELGTVIGTLSSSVGGGSNCLCLLLPLKILASQEETVVREEAIESFKLILKELPSNDISREVINILQELTDGDWFTSRISACALFAYVYEKLEKDTDKNRIHDLFNALCNDDTPMVRRAAANCLGELAKVMDQEIIIGQLLPQFKILVADDQDSVRLITIEHCKDITSRLTQDKNIEHMLPIIRSCSEDKSWKVRQTIAKDYGALAQSIGAEKSAIELLPYLMNFLNDPEGEVKCCAIKNIKAFLDLIGAEALKRADLYEYFARLSKDPMVAVKTELAITCMQLSVVVPKSVTSIVQSLLLEDVPEIRISILSKLSSLVESGDIECVRILLPEVIKLYNDKQWRVRDSIAQHMADLGKSLGQQYFDSNLLNIFITLLEDPVNSVRNRVTNGVGELYKVFGTNWIKEKIVPVLNNVYNKSVSFYLKRNTILFAIQSLVQSITNDSAMIDLVFPLVVKGTEDKVANVRLISANTLGMISKKVSKEFNAKSVLPLLTKLSQDGDKDVQFFSSLRLEESK